MKSAMSNECSGNLSSPSLFLLGVAIGTSAALLLAPMSGQQMRASIRRRTHEGAQAVRTRLGETREKATALMEDAHEMVDSHLQHLAGEKERIAAALRAGREAYRSTPTAETALG